MFSTPAFAQAAGASPAGAFDFMSLMPLILIFVLFYFLLIRPQQKKMKQHKDMIAAVKRGDQVILGGGIRGRVTKVVDDNAQVEIAEGVRVHVIKATITDVVAKAEPFKESKGKEEIIEKEQIEKSAPEKAAVLETPGMTKGKAFRVLGLTEGATSDQVNDAYRKKMALVHPDKGGSSIHAQEINAARDVLLGQ